jgi:5-methylthioadenosine/S-adenosylhomocysteine deaminase
MPASPIDPLEGPRYMLTGRVVTMDANYSVIQSGLLCLDAGRIVAVQDADAPLPDGFADAPLIHTGGTIYPGLIELHNHLSYNILPIWQVPQRFTNRDRWSNHEEKRARVSGPMQLLTQQPASGYVEAVVRYVECKCLVAGVTTSQGVTLASAPGIIKRYRGIVRNVEATGDRKLPEAKAQIADVAAGQVKKFAKEIGRLQEKGQVLLMHLSEGVDDRARGHFLKLQLPDGAWAINDALAGIHATALAPADLAIMGQHGGAIVWSPLSNYLLYGGSADVAAAKAAGLLIGLGSDWSPSGSKNLLGELKVARLVNDSLGQLFTDRELVALVTTNPARILKWHGELGSIERDKRADLLVLAGETGDPYGNLIGATEAAVNLVVINGVPRYGLAGLMSEFGGQKEALTVGGSERQVFLAQLTADTVVGKLTLGEAIRRLQLGLSQLPEPQPIPASERDILRRAPGWMLVLDNDGHEAAARRPLQPEPGEEEMAALRAAARPLSEIVKPLPLDGLTAVDDAAYVTSFASQGNLPEFIRTGLPQFYSPVM